MNWKLGPQISPRPLPPETQPFSLSSSYLSLLFLTSRIQEQVPVPVIFLFHVCRRFGRRVLILIICSVIIYHINYTRTVLPSSLSISEKAKRDVTQLRQHSAFNVRAGISGPCTEQSPFQKNVSPPEEGMVWSSEPLLQLRIAYVGPNSS